MTACLNASINLGLQLGDDGKDFIGNHGLKGCHAKRNVAYYGIEETDINKHRTTLVKPFYRPLGYDCGIHLYIKVIFHAFNLLVQKSFHSYAITN